MLGIEIIFFKPCNVVRDKVTIDTYMKKCKSLKNYFIQH